MNRDSGGWPVWKILVWAVLALGMGAWMGRGFIRNLRNSDFVMDFFQEWSSGRNFWFGRPIYAPQEDSLAFYLGLQYVPAGGAAQVPAKPSPSQEAQPSSESRPILIVLNDVNAHPPSSVLLALPLARLDYWDAFLTWNLLSLAALGICGWLVVRNLGIRFRIWSWLPTITLLLVCNPFRQQINLG
jgi:hypothetical protein